VSAGSAQPKKAVVRMSLASNLNGGNGERVMDRLRSEVIGHIAMQQCGSMSDVIVSDIADYGHQSIPFAAERFTET